jgi:hypothetical protein
MKQIVKTNSNPTTERIESCGEVINLPASFGLAGGWTTKTWARTCGSPSCLIIPLNILEATTNELDL